MNRRISAALMAARSAAVIRIQRMTATELGDWANRSRKPTGVPYFDSDNFDWTWEESLRGTYWTAWAGKNLVGVRKFYLWPNRRADLFSS